ncbi:ARMT1-like domain-containing protein [Prolixibacter sp. NT017]|uniref:ARMT1-like domain-containing protein n=1 Tax=Prolixibacter sp. NT017 TaxID=2652390 RepID=UPI001288C8EE|nr:ARMT1-like domain-containing protein [Prolixibacter sp. NT017]GET25072.1 hypothetical protein NT017_14010 [Prolixibacter sp. NT017]
MFPECVKCIVNQAEQLLQRNSVDKEQANEVVLDLLRFMAGGEDEAKAAPALPAYMNNLLNDRFRIDTALKNERRLINDHLLHLEEIIRDSISRATRPAQKALQYSLAGNSIMNYLNPLDVTEDAMRTAAAQMPVIDDSDRLFAQVKNARTVLFIGDKAGETVTDKLLMEQLRHPRMYYAVRQKGVLYEATVDDAYQAGIDKVARIIGIPGDIKSFSEVPEDTEAGKIYREADVIISKGEHNFWRLHQEGKRDIFFLVSVNCQVVSKLLHVRKGHTVVMHQEQYRRRTAAQEKRPALKRRSNDAVQQQTICTQNVFPGPRF